MVLVDLPGQLVVLRTLHNHGFLGFWGGLGFRGVVVFSKLQGGP